MSYSSEEESMSFSLSRSESEDYSSEEDYSTSGEEVSYSSSRENSDDEYFLNDESEEEEIIKQSIRGKSSAITKPVFFKNAVEKDVERIKIQEKRLEKLALHMVNLTNMYKNIAEKVNVEFEDEVLMNAYRYVFGCNYN